MTESTCSFVTRRQFLAGLGASVTVAACGGQGVTVYRRADRVDASLATTATSLTPAAAMPAGSVPLTDRTLIVVELGGGNDSLSTVVPQSGRYRDLRPTTAIEDPIDLDGEIGLHPALGTIAERYRMGQVAIVEGLGTSNPDMSHFVSMRRWWDGTDRADHTGWLGRYLDAAVGYDQVLAGISIGPGPSPAMLGASSYVVGVSDAAGLASGFPWWVDDIRDFAGVWSGFAPADVPITELDPVRRAIVTAASAQRDLQGAIDPLAARLDEIAVDTSSLEGQLALAGALAISDVSPRVLYVHGNVDFDTHQAQLGRHGELMGQLDRGLGHLLAIVDEAGMSDSVAVMTTSEFGRRAGENDGGTDHGAAGTHFVIGAGVAGGRYGEAPSLTNLDPYGNLIHTVDYRSLYASVIDGWLQAGHGEILREEHEVLPLFSGA